MSRDPYKEREISFSPSEIGNCPDIYEVLKKRSGLSKLRIVRSFIDARHKDSVKIIYRVTGDVSDKREEHERTAIPFIGRSFSRIKPPVIIGFGPAGMFAGLVLARLGFGPVILEMGSDVKNRSEAVDKTRAEGVIDPCSNIQFGEGGAGTFSDGKLFSGVRSPFKDYIYDTLIRSGAPADISYDSHPHVGTDNLVKVVSGIREEIIRNGGQVIFDSKVTSILHDGNGNVRGVVASGREYLSDHVILAAGHSSRDLFRYLYANGFAMENKPFSVGVRIEHRRYDIDMAQYGFDTSLYRNISASNYKLSCDTVTGRKLYTFCMCPGGVVVPASSTPDGVCTNGMSYRSRDLENSNSALLVPVGPETYGDNVLSGMIFQELLEKRAFIAGGSNMKAPAVRYADLKKGKVSSGFGGIKPTYLPGVSFADMREIFPDIITDTLIDGISRMGRMIKGFDCDDALLSAVEARSSSPVRILRDKDTLMSLNMRGLYPAGEGAGYAGGIMSSAIDGIKCADKIAESVLN